MFQMFHMLQNLNPPHLGQPIHLVRFNNLSPQAKEEEKKKEKYKKKKMFTLVNQSNWSRRLGSPRVETLPTKQNTLLLLLLLLVVVLLLFI